MIQQLKDAITTLIVSAFSKKFIAFIVILVPLLRAKQWNEAIGLFLAYAGIETADKKFVTKPTPAPAPEPIPPEATPAPEETVVIEEQ